MYVDKLTITNFRCFANAEVHFNYPGRKPQRGHQLPDQFKNVTLFIGGNGSGKTTVFKALCLAVLAPIIRNSGLRVDFFVRRPVGYNGDQSTGNSDTPPLANANIIAKLVVDDIDTTARPLSKPYLLGQAIVHHQGDFEDVTFKDVTIAHTHQDAWKNIFKNASPAFFLVAYGSNRSAANPEGYTDRPRSPRYQRIANIFEEYAALVPFTVGFQELDKRKLLDEARLILNRLLPDAVILSDVTDRENRPLFESFGVLHPFGALSDGYRGFISWVWDLMVQMARVMAPNANAAQFKRLSGVVIVDEIDLFLHPRWQRRLIEELALEFPNLQFIFSTHSPLVVGMLVKENVRVLSRSEDGCIIEEYQEEVEGKTPNEILTGQYFNLSSTRSPRSGTLSEQMQRELNTLDFSILPETSRLSSVSEEQKQALYRMMAQSREYDKAIHKAEVEVAEQE